MIDVHLITTIDRGGAENFLVRLLTASPNTRRTTVIFLKGGGYWTDTLQHNGISVINAGMKFYGDPLPLLRIIFYVLKNRVFQILCHMPPAEVYGYLVRLMTLGRRPRFVIYRHNSERYYSGIFARRLCKRITQSADIIICSSTAVCEFYHSYAGYKHPNEHVVEYGIDVECVEDSVIIKPSIKCPHQFQTPLPGGGMRIISVCRLVPQKDVSTLIKAFHAFNRSEDKAHRLIIVGDGPERHSLSDLVARLGVGDEVEFTGATENPYLAIFHSDVFVLSTHYEGFGLVVLEAWALQKPVVASNIPPLNDILSDGEDGLLFDVGDINGLCKHFASLKDPALRRSLGERGKVRVGARYDLRFARDNFDAICL